METSQMWCQYMVSKLDNHELDALIIKTKCQIQGCRINKKGIKNFPISMKINALNKKPGIENEVMKTIAHMYKDLLQDEKVIPYQDLTIDELIEKKDELDQLDKTYKIATLNHFFLGTEVMPIEKERLFATFVLKELFEEEEEKVLTEANMEMPEPPQQKVVAPEKLAKKQKSEVIDNPDAKEETLSRKQLKEYKTLKFLIQEVKTNEELYKKKYQQEVEKVKTIEKKLAQLESETKISEKNLQQQLAKIETAHRVLQEEKTNLEEHIQKMNRDEPYIFIGSAFTHMKMQKLQASKAAYKNVHMLYLSTKQWSEGLGRAADRVKEVYVFNYDVERELREAIQTTYATKVKFFNTDDRFYEYITHCWEV